MIKWEAIHRAVLKQVNVMTSMLLGPLSPNNLSRIKNKIIYMRAKPLTLMGKSFNMDTGYKLGREQNKDTRVNGKTGINMVKGYIVGQMVALTTESTSKI